MKTILHPSGSPLRPLPLRRLVFTRVLPALALVPVFVVFAAGLTPSAARGESGAIALAAPLIATQTGKFRTKGPFALYVGNSKVIGGDGPVWVSFRSNGSMIAEGDRWVTRWKKTSKGTRLILNRKVLEAEVGSISSIRYRKSALRFSGNSVSGNIDCRFKIRGVPARFHWKFEGRRM